MKSTSIFLILCGLLFSNTLFSQAVNYCDSLKKCMGNKSKPTSSIHNRGNDNGITITIDNSHFGSQQTNGKTPENGQCPPSCQQCKEPGTPTPIWVSIVVVMIAGIITLIQVRSNTIASSRIEWINSLRKMLGQYYTEALNSAAFWNDYYTVKNGHNKNDEEEEKKRSKYHGALSKYNALSNAIRMHLNSNEREHQKIERILDKIDNILGVENQDEIDLIKFENYLREIVGSAKIILKKEWQKSKKLFWLFKVG